MDLIQLADGSWAEVAPDACPSCGHPWVRGGCKVSWQPCNCAGGSGHRTYRCDQCDVETFDPPHTPGSWEGTAYTPVVRV